MVRLNINRKRSGVPVLSRKQIDDIGERLVQDFCPDAMIHPQALDVDLFAQDYLGMEQGLSVSFPLWGLSRHDCF